MLKLGPEEKILLVLHHHWISLVGPALIAALLFLAPFFAYPFAASLHEAPLLMPLFLFASSLWFLFALLIGFVFWIDYYLDAMVITSRRILTIAQEGLFKNTLSEFSLEKVQDVTIEIPHFAATFFGYGNITIQTAGEMSFSIQEVPDVYKVKELIIAHAKRGSV